MIKNNMKQTEFLTTGQVAQYCGVNFRTVIRWIKKGLLPAQRLPGRGDHRINRSQFIAFLKQNEFTVPLELLPQNAPELHTPSPATSADKDPILTGPAEPSKIRVLIVDDDQITANAIQRVLALHGYETQIALDGFTAGQMLETFKPHLMTLDMMMQGLDGMSVLRSVRQNRRFDHLKILVISGDTEEKLNLATKSGANLAIKKPYYNDTLLQAARDLTKEFTEAKNKLEPRL